VADVQVLEDRTVLSPPTAPGAPMLTGLGATSATISWGASTDNVPIASYSVYWIYTYGHSGRGGGITTYTILEATTNGSTTSATISGLTQNKGYTFYVKAKDSAGYSSAYSPGISVVPGAAPTGLMLGTVGSTGYASLSVVANHQFQAQLKASSFPAITYSVVNPPSGMTVDPVSGIVTWTPTAANVGTTSVTFQATNTFASTSITLPITVTADVPVPSFTFTNTASPTLNVVGFPIGLQINDASNTPSTYTVVSAPAGVSIDPNTGTVNWVPTADEVGNAPLTFQLTNSAGTAQITVNPVIYVSDAPQNVTVTDLNTLAPMLSWSPPNYNDNLIGGYYVWITGPDYYNDQFTTSGPVTSTVLDALTVYPGSYQVNIAAVGTNGGMGLWNTSLSFFYNPSVPQPTYAFTSNGGGAYAVPGQQATIQVSDLNTSSPDTYALLSGPDGMSIDPNSGLATWTPTLTDLANGTASAVVAVTNAVGTSYVSLYIPVYFASAANNVAASFGPNGQGLNITWSDPTAAAETIAGYDVYISWVDGDGLVHNLAPGFAAEGTDQFTVSTLPGDAVSFTITVVAVDPSGIEGAYPLAGTTILRNGGGGGGVDT
jgi:hypothetical protein